MNQNKKIFCEDDDVFRELNLRTLLGHKTVQFRDQVLFLFRFHRLRPDGNGLFDCVNVDGIVFLFCIEHIVHLTCRGGSSLGRGGARRVVDEQSIVGQAFGAVTLAVQAAIVARAAVQSCSPPISFDSNIVINQRQSRLCTQGTAHTGQPESSQFRSENGLGNHVRRDEKHGGKYHQTKIHFLKVRQTNWAQKKKKKRKINKSLAVRRARSRSKFTLFSFLFLSFRTGGVGEWNNFKKKAIDERKNEKVGVVKWWNQTRGSTSTMLEVNSK